MWQDLAHILHPASCLHNSGLNLRILRKATNGLLFLE